jgi:hypothetical protein
MVLQVLQDYASFSLPFARKFCRFAPESFAVSREHNKTKLFYWASWLNVQTEIPSSYTPSILHF